jgi:hypothetical protein
LQALIHPLTQSVLHFLQIGNRDHHCRGLLTFVPSLTGQHKHGRLGSILNWSVVVRITSTPGSRLFSNRLPMLPVGPITTESWIDVACAHMNNPAKQIGVQS